jgi:hypothetical protein
MASLCVLYKRRPNDICVATRDLGRALAGGAPTEEEEEGPVSDGTVAPIQIQMQPAGNGAEVIRKRNAGQQAGAISNQVNGITFNVGEKRPASLRAAASKLAQ